jgi:hypothetical protein
VNHHVHLNQARGGANYRVLAGALGGKEDRQQRKSDVHNISFRRGLEQCSVPFKFSLWGRAILPAAGFQPARPAGKRVCSLDRLPHR